MIDVFKIAMTEVPVIRSLKFRQIRMLLLEKAKRSRSTTRFKTSMNLLISCSALTSSLQKAKSQ